MSGFQPPQPAVPMKIPTTLDGGDVETHEEVILLEVTGLDSQGDGVRS